MDEKWISSTGVICGGKGHRVSVPTPVHETTTSIKLTVDQYALLNYPLWFILLLRWQFRGSHALPNKEELLVHFHNIYKLVSLPRTRLECWLKDRLLKFIYAQREVWETMVSASVVTAEEFNKLIKDSTLLD